VISIEEILDLYSKKKEEIKIRLEEFIRMKNQDDVKIFSELCFCLCTPQSKALLCWEAIERLRENGILFTGNPKKIEKMLRGVRFKRTKARRIVKAREQFFGGGNSKIKEVLNEIEDDYKLREWLVKNIDGFGMKEASHFMRNIGRGNNVAILDRHVLKNLQNNGVIEKIPKTMTEKKYLEIERKTREFANSLGIPLAELDILFWSKESGVIFK